MPGHLIDGRWEAQTSAATNDKGGAFQRKASAFRATIAPGGEHPPEPGRYHLYVSYACPWAHRTLIFRKLKGLESLIGVSVVHWLMGDDGWTFADGPGVIPDTVNGFRELWRVYVKAKPDYSGKVTVPVLWDKTAGTIVNNESSEIIRIFNSAFDSHGAAPGDYYPLPLRPQIDALNARIYDTVNNGVYRCGFASSQSAYDEAVAALFATLDDLEARLAESAFLLGPAPTEADWRLFVTLLRFDPVYVGLFKCNIRRIADYPNLSRYRDALRAWPGVEETIRLDHIKRHYYESLRFINPTGIVPAGPAEA
jgi:putative glutathione S-transferase